MVGRSPQRPGGARHGITWRYDPYGLNTDFGRGELLWINNALAEVLGGPEAIEEWEFYTRIGGDRDAVRVLQHKVHDEVGALRRADPEW